MDNVHGDAKQCLGSQNYDEISTPSLLASSGLRDFEPDLNSVIEYGRDGALDISSLSETSFDLSKSFEEFSRNSKILYKWDYIAKKIIDCQNNIFVLKRQISLLKKDRISEEEMELIKKSHEAIKEKISGLIRKITNSTEYAAEDRKAITELLIEDIKEAGKNYFTTYSGFQSVNQSIQNKNKMISSFVARIEQFKKSLKALAIENSLKALNIRRQAVKVLKKLNKSFNRF